MPPFDFKGFIKYLSAWAWIKKDRHLLRAGKHPAGKDIKALQIIWHRSYGNG